MAHKFNLSVSVSTNADVTGEQVAKILQTLINAGLADACATVEAAENCDSESFEMAQLATDPNISDPVLTPTETSVPVKYWGAYGVEGTVDTHQFDLIDQREPHGQAYITVGALEGNLDDMLSVTMEVNTNPLNGVDHVPCAHVHFDDDAMAVSLFKIGNKILVRPETNVSITGFRQKLNGFPEQLYWID